MRSYGYPFSGTIEYMYDNYVHVPHLSKAADEDRKILTTGGWLTDAHICSFPKRRCCRTRSLLHPGQNSKLLNLLKSIKMVQTTRWFLASRGKMLMFYYRQSIAAGEQASSNTQGAPTIKCCTVQELGGWGFQVLYTKTAMILLTAKLHVHPVLLWGMTHSPSTRTARPDTHCL